MENHTNGDVVVMNEMSSKNQLKNVDIPNYYNGNGERSNLISSSVDAVDGSHDGRSNGDKTSSDVRHLPLNRRTATTATDVSVDTNFFPAVCLLTG